MSDTAPQNTLGPGSVDWRDLYKDPYLITAVVLALLVSVPLASPADTEFWLNEYSYYFDAPLLALTALALWKAASMAPSPRAQRFWKYLTVGFGFWLAIRLGGPFLTGTSPAAMLVTDLLYLAFYLFWLLPMLGFIAAARLYARSSSGSDDLPAPAEFEELLWKWRGKLAYLALIPPMLHIALQITGWADDSTGTARDVFIVLWVFAAFGLSILYDRSLLSQQHRFAQRHSQTNQQLEVVRRMDAMHGGWHSSRFQ